MDTADTDHAFMRASLIVIAFMFAFISPDAHATEGGNMTMLVIADNSTSNYVIVISETASPSERHAADELQFFLKEISGANLPIVTDGGELKSHEIILGDNLHLKQLNAEIDFDALGDDGFTIRTEGNYLIVAGGKQRGTMYGVYT
ncbi:MAG: alpha-glucuronidase family glycosyl hydrolase, partial [Candidatus Poribacteria bacterium]|nr:alpha-glucuronidase family glycosyl hydrolase [Candidatus Poribacteria bacterium]